MRKARQEPSYYRECCGSIERQCGFILLPVVLAITLIATIAFLINTESAINVDMTANTTAAAEAEQVARAGLAHATWGVQNSGCAGDMTMTTVPFGQAGTGSYTATVTTPGGSTSGYPNLVTDQDAWFRSDNITNNNGTANTLHLRRESGNIEYAVLRFDLSSLPAGAQINSALAHLFVVSGKGHPEGPVTIHRVTADWTETGATWETMGDKFDTAVLATIPAQPAAGAVRVTVNLTAQVQAWVNGGEPNYGIILIPTGEGTHAEYISREGTASTQPRMDVLVGTGPASPATITVTGTLAGNPSPANDITRTLSRTAVPAYQPPGTISLQLGIDAGEDGMPDSFYTNRNYGGADYMQVNDDGSGWQQYPLIRFDLAGLPRGAAVHSARLELRLWSLLAPGTASIHQVTRSWVEGTKSGTGTADGATWFTHDGTNAWTSAGGDINAPAVAETAIDGSETWVGWEIGPLVERWLAGEPNHGLQIRPGNGLKQANFASKENATVGVQPKLTITYACECGSPCLAPQGSGNVLMFVVNPTTLVPADSNKKALFESWGYTVTVISESANQTTIDAAVVNNDVVYVSNTVNSNTLGTRLAGVPVGVVTDDGDYNSDLGFATGSGYAVGAAIDVTDTSHYITAVFSAGALSIYDADMEGLTVGGTPAPDLQSLADWGTITGLAVLESGAATAGGGTSAGRRVMLPLGPNPGFNWDYLNANGQLLLHRALLWGMNADGGLPPKNLLLVVADATTPSMRSAGRKTLMESWGYTVTLIDDNDSQANFDTAMAANDVVYVTDTVSGPTLVDKVTHTTTPVVNEKGSKLGNFGFSSSESGTVNAAGFTSTDAAHYISEPFSGNPVTVFTSSLSMGVPDGTLAPDLQNAGEVSGTPALAALEDGATLWNGGSAPARRVHLPLGAAETTQLTADGETLMRRAIEWAEGAGTATTGLLAHWKLDETTGPTAVDSVGGHHGTLANDPSWTTGHDNGALNFDGSDDYVDLTSDAELDDVFLGGATVMAWIYADSWGGGNYGRILDKSSEISGERDGWMIGLFGDNQAVSLAQGFTGGRGFWRPQNGTFPLNEWVHVAFVYDSSSDANDPVIYQNGIVQTSMVEITPIGSIRSDADITLRMGNHAYSTTRTFDGKLDDVRIYDRMLSDAEIAELATGGVSAQTVLLVVGDATTLASKDAGYKALIESWGHTVTLIDDGDSQANYDTAMDAADVILVSGTTSGPSLLDKVTGTTTGVVNEINGKLDNFGFSSSTSSTANFDTFSTTDAAHYITEPFSGNPVTVFTASLTNPVPGGTLAPDLQKVGFVSATLALGTLDTGAKRHDGNPSPGRRAHLPFAAAETTDMTADGKTILKRALEWAAGAGDGSGGGGGGGGGPTGVVFEEFTEAALSNGTSLVIDKPTGTVSGDLLIAAVATDGNTVGSLAPPAGWNVVDLTSQGGAVTFAVWWKLAGASEPGTYTMTWSGNEHAYGWLMRFSGHDPVNPIDVSTNTGGTSSSPSSPAVTTTADDALVLRLGGFDDDDITTGAPGLSGHTAINMGDSGNGPATASGGSGYVMQTTAGSSGTSNFTLTGNEEYRAVTIGIAPAP